MRGGHAALRVILAWWNADSLGGFNLSDIFAVDRAVGRDIASVVIGVVESRSRTTPTPIAARSRSSSGSGAGGLGAFG